MQRDIGKVSREEQGLENKFKPRGCGVRLFGQGCVGFQRCKGEDDKDRSFSLLNRTANDTALVCS